jgi:PASTA domain
VAALLHARLSRLALSALALLLATAGLTSAASNQQSAPTAQAQATRTVLVVPKVRGQAYVFAKGILEDSGFAWRVVGGVNGFAANLVSDQSPAPGTRVVDTGAPTITLRLSRSTKYAEDGVSENFSSFPGTRILRPGAAKPPAAKPDAKPPAPAKRSAKPAAKPPKAAAKKRPAARPKAAPTKPKPAPANPKPQAKKASARPAAFTVPGAPKEPLDEMPLPKRARLLAAWAAKHTRPTDANVAHWLYQHAWIVTGAKFGWWRGAEALRVLIAVDERVISNWGIGTRSQAVARTALAEVEAKSS